MENRHITVLAAVSILLALLASLSGLTCLPKPIVDDASVSRQLREEEGRKLMLGFGLSNDPKTTTLRGNPEGIILDRAPLAGEATHDSDRLCIAKVDDSNVLSASVLDEGGHLQLSLPKDYKAEVTIECIQYERVGESPGNESSVVLGTSTIRDVVARQGGVFEPQTCNPDDRKRLRPGHYDRRYEAWVDHCTGRWFSASKAASSARLATVGLPLAPANCPMVADLLSSGYKGPVWISFVGDSVTRNLYVQVTRELGAPAPDGGEETSVLRNFYMTRVTVGGVDFWLSHQFHYAVPGQSGEVGINGGAGQRLPHTWGDYVRNRASPELIGPKRPPRLQADPPFEADRMPDLTLYSPGYHSSAMSSREYKAEVEVIMGNWRDVARELQGGDLEAPVPPVHIFLKMMPATWLITEKYAYDRVRRTLLNEYRYNLGIMGAARQFDFVKGVIDVFSAELPFNGEEGGYTAHKDAVHLSDTFVAEILGDRVLEAICTSDLRGGGRAASQEGGAIAK